jgi:DNA-binding NarL/FixJ family response regulator
MIRVSIVEDVADVRRGLVALIAAADGFVAASDHGDAESALDALSRVRPDVVLMDIGLPGMDGMEATLRIRNEHPEVQIIMLTVYADDARIFESLRAGANGYVLKTTPATALLESIASVHAGGSPMSSTIARRVVGFFHAVPRAPDPTAELTPRERDILALLVEGFRYREIGAQLGITLDTVRTHIRHIYEKLQVRSRTEATARVLRWTSPPGER